MQNIWPAKTFVKGIFYINISNPFLSYISAMSSHENWLEYSGDSSSPSRLVSSGTVHEVQIRRSLPEVRISRGGNGVMLVFGPSIQICPVWLSSGLTGYNKLQTAFSMSRGKSRTSDKQAIRTRLSNTVFISRYSINLPYRLYTAPQKRFVDDPIGVWAGFHRLGLGHPTYLDGRIDTAAVSPS